MRRVKSDEEEIREGYTCNRCLQDFSVWPSQIHDKHAITCPHCGYLNNLYPDPEPLQADPTT